MSKKLRIALTVVFVVFMEILCAIVGAALWVENPVAGAALAIIIGIPISSLMTCLVHGLFELIS